MTRLLRPLLLIPIVLLCCFLALGAKQDAHAQQQGQCSAYDADVEWLESAYDQYSICYVAQYSEDVEFVSQIIEDAKQLMLDKYEEETLRNRHGELLHVSIMLVPEPNHEASTGATRFKCCYDSSGELDSRGTFAQIPYLALGHSDWRRFPTFGGARLTPENYHAKNLVHEFVHAIQHTIWGSNRNVPLWFSEGQAEYDGMFNATEYNRTAGFRNLIERVHRRHRDDILLGQTLSSDEQRLVVTEVYFSASVVLRYLSLRFGEDIQLRLMKHTETTFNEALTVEIEAAGSTVQAEFEGMRDWLDRCYDDSRDCDVDRLTPGGDAEDDDGGSETLPEQGDGTAADGGEPEPVVTPGVSVSAAQPQVGVALTASVADPDKSVSSARWKWESSADGQSGWTLRAIGGGLTSTYTPASSDEGKYLRATATYITSEGRTKRASKKSDNPVVSP